MGRDTNQCLVPCRVESSSLGVLKDKRFRLTREGVWYIVIENGK